MSNRSRVQCIVLIYIGLTRTPLLAWLVMHGWVLQTLASILLGAALGWPLRPVVQGRGWRLLPLVLVLIAVALLVDDVLIWGVFDLTITTLVLVAAWPASPRRRKRNVSLERSARRRRWSTGIPLRSARN